jgi:HAD superfamily hydrolase (TIGR01484 family)
MEPFKGTIGLDIDGTVTIHKNFIEEKVVNFLEKLAKAGWRVVFLTGRTLSFSRPLFKGFRIPFFLSVQNGAALYTMPDEMLKKKHYIQRDFLAPLVHILSKKGIGALVESGSDNQDICYYHLESFSQFEREYIDFRISISPEKWESVPFLEKVPISDFPVIKFFADEKTARILASEIQQKMNHLIVTVIRDPFRPGFHLAHINDYKASKGKTLEEFSLRMRPLIVAGDDYNDIEMLQKGDVKIVMKNAPLDMHKLGDILAPPASQGGIIDALTEAIRRYER